MIRYQWSRERVALPCFIDAPAQNDHDGDEDIETQNERKRERREEKEKFNVVSERLASSIAFASIDTQMEPVSEEAGGEEGFEKKTKLSSDE